ncbi:GAF domain-containing protein [Kaistella jeonii]|uniref:GAF domain-containing protein n=1 Tax=Kaistella jeonii TaxID=266749 RepID=UPI000A685C7F|nr:GAF domain-containing protein [Kaistella jeonii]
MKVLEDIRDHDDVDFRRDYAGSVLKKIENIPEFQNGIYDFGFIEIHQELIRQVLADLFPVALTHNEIKAANFPFTNGTFNYTKRFRTILDDAGFDFEMKYRAVEEDDFYIFKCSIIILKFYKKEIQYNLPLYYDIPTADGIIKHYKTTINGDFIDVYPKLETTIPTNEEVDFLLENLEDIKLWKQFFPPESWVMKGFTIITLIDTTAEVSLQDLKSKLLKFDIENFTIDDDFTTLFRSYFNIPDLFFGIIPFNKKDRKFKRIEMFQNVLSNHAVEFLVEISQVINLDDARYQHLNFHKHPVIISDIEKLDEEIKNSVAFQILKANKIRSFIVLPLIFNTRLMAALEFNSNFKNAFSQLKLKKIEFIIPSILYTIQRFHFERINQLEAIIQREYTVIQKSVYWKFQQQAEEFFSAKMANKNYNFQEITFENLVPLYGQTDIQSSSQLRSSCLSLDLNTQIISLREIISKISDKLVSKFYIELKDFEEEICCNLKADTEQRFQGFLKHKIHPFLRECDFPEINNFRTNYFSKIFLENEIFYDERKKLDDSIATTNCELATLLDAEQIKAQEIFPHYFERFKTDGVEHNLYIGSSINPSLHFDSKYVSALREWQLKTVCSMEQKFHKIQKDLPIPLEVTSLIMAYNNEISIRFRMDEKRFDVDGAYNSRYEIIKKRIEKANIKGTKNRLVTPRKITIVYFSEASKNEFLQFLKPLQKTGILEQKIEDLQVEDLQGIIGLRALRISLILSI